MRPPICDGQGADEEELIDWTREKLGADKRVVRANDCGRINVMMPLATRITPITAAPIVAAGRPLRPIQALNRLILSCVPSGANT